MPRGAEHTRRPPRCNNTRNGFTVLVHRAVSNEHRKDCFNDQGLVAAIPRQALVSRSAPMPILRRPMVSRAAFDCMSSCPDVAAIMRFASEYDKPRPGPLSETFVAPPLPLSALRCGLVGVTVARSIWICDRGRRRFEDAWCHGSSRVRIATGSSVSRARVSRVAVGKFQASQ